VELISGDNSGRVALASRSAQVAPINIAAQLLASDLPASGALDVRAVLRRNASSLDPLLNGLVAPDLKRLGSPDDAAQNADRAKNGGLSVHASHPIQEKLALQLEIPAVTQADLVNTIACMESIHARIKRLRLAKGMSMQALADAVGAKAWQTVQQWENEDAPKPTAPSRSRQPLVAAALGVTVEELMHGAQEGQQRGKREETAAREPEAKYGPAITNEELALLADLRELLQPRRDEYARMIKAEADVARAYMRMAIERKWGAPVEDRRIEENFPTVAEIERRQGERRALQNEKRISSEGAPRDKRKERRVAK